MILLLPNEILLSIAESLDFHTDLSAFLRTCRQLYELLATTLYRRDVLRDASSALLWAAANGQPTTAMLSVAAGADPDGYGLSPLKLAAICGHASVVSYLLDRTLAEADHRDSTGRTPLSWAASEGHEDVVARLMATMLVDVDSADERGRTPLHWAASRGHAAIKELLLGAAKADAHSQDARGETAARTRLDSGM